MAMSIDVEKIVAPLDEGVYMITVAWSGGPYTDELVLHHVFRGDPEAVDAELSVDDNAQWITLRSGEHKLAEAAQANTCSVRLIGFGEDEFDEDADRYESWGEDC